MSASCTVPYCCCGCDLRSGTLIIGWLELVISAINVGLQADLAAKNSTSDGVAILWTSFGVSLFGVVIAICLLVGVYQVKPILLHIWTCIQMVLVAINVSVGIYIMAVIGTTALIIGIPLLFGGLLNIYFIIVVRSTAVRMEEYPIHI